ncbi:MAG: complex I NDUFA9 subunit family protein [Pseudomonadota bacterium]
MSNLATIYGGSGFVGRYIARRLAKAGWRVRVAVRRPNEAMFVRTYGTVGQVEPVLCNIRNDASVAAAMDGANAVINCVGTFDKGGKNNFDAVQHLGAERIARLAAAAGVARMVHISAIGADAQGPTLYAKSKGLGEEGVREHMPGAVILRPSVIFGPEDEFFNRFAGMTRTSPFIPLVGASAKFQPVYVDDVAAAAEKGVLGSAAGVYELGGPEIATFRSLIEDMLKIVRRRRLVLGLPLWVGRIMGWGFDLLGTLSGGLIKGPITLDQAKSLAVDNIVSDGAKTLADLGIEATAKEAILDEYLWRFRPSGQYSDIKESAKNLKA